MIRTVVADRNETIRLGLRAIFDQQGGKFAVVEAANRSDLIEKIEKNACQLVVVDPLLCGGSGGGLIREIRLLSPTAHVLVYTELDELTFGVSALRSGAKGYLMKNCPSSELLTAIARVSAGKLHMSDALAEEVAYTIWEKRDEKPHQTLSDREKTIFSMLVCGRTVTSIAGILNLSPKTVSTHKSRAMAKLRCKSLSEVVHYAIDNGLKEECEARCQGW